MLQPSMRSNSSAYGSRSRFVDGQPFQIGHRQGLHQPVFLVDLQTPISRWIGGGDEESNRAVDSGRGTGRADCIFFFQGDFVADFSVNHGRFLKPMESRRTEDSRGTQRQVVRPTARASPPTEKLFQVRRHHPTKDRFYLLISYPVTIIGMFKRLQATWITWTMKKKDIAHHEPKVDKAGSVIAAKEDSAARTAGPVCKWQMQSGWIQTHKRIISV